MREIIFIRHGATAGNLEKRYIGRTDEPLCEVGLQQIQLLKQQNFQIDALFVSPALRTRQTAALLFPGMDTTIVHDLRETDFGQFEGRTAAELSDSAAYRTWVDARCLTPIPDGECISDFKTRCSRAFLKAMDSIPDNSTAAFVMHGGCIMAILEAFAQPKRDFYAYHISNGGFIWCHYKDNTLQIMEHSQS